LSFDEVILFVYLALNFGISKAIIIITFDQFLNGISFPSSVHVHIVVVVIIVVVVVIVIVVVVVDVVVDVDDQIEDDKHKIEQTEERKIAFLSRQDLT